MRQTHIVYMKQVKADFKAHSHNVLLTQVSKASKVDSCIEVNYEFFVFLRKHNCLPQVYASNGHMDMEIKLNKTKEISFAFSKECLF